MTLVGYVRFSRITRTWVVHVSDEQFATEHYISFKFDPIGSAFAARVIARKVGAPVELRLR